MIVMQNRDELRKKNGDSSLNMEVEVHMTRRKVTVVKQVK